MTDFEKLEKLIETAIIKKNLPYIARTNGNTIVIVPDVPSAPEPTNIQKVHGLVKDLPEGSAVNASPLNVPEPQIRSNVSKLNRRLGRNMSTYKRDGDIFIVNHSDDAIPRKMMETRDRHNQPPKKIPQNDVAAACAKLGIDSYHFKPTAPEEYSKEKSVSEHQTKSRWVPSSELGDDSWEPAEHLNQ